jgi:hypothetical protein
MPDEHPASPPEDLPTLTWRVFRAKETPRRTVLTVAFILLILAIVAVSYRDPLWVLLALVVLFLALNGYFLPTTYTFDRRGITTDKLLFRYTRRWNEFRSFFRTTGGIVVSPFTTWSYLDNFRGVHLLLPEDSEPILAYLAQRLPEKKREPKRRVT